MKRLILAGWLLAASGLVAEDPPKPSVLKDDELAVLFDAKSPDRPKLFERYDRKLVQIDGRLFCNTPGQKPRFYIDPPKGKFKEKDSHLPVAVEWSSHLQNTAIQNHLKKKSNEFHSLPMGRVEDAYGKWPVTTVYGWFSKGTLLEAATDPMIVGPRPEEKKKDPARLKD